MALEPHSHLGPYEILAKLGAGGMGEVYRAFDPRLERNVAIKVLPEKLAKDEVALGRFHREVRAVAKLSHANIVAVYDIDSDQGRIYAVMELLEGQTLGKRIRQGRMDWREAVNWATEIAEGLAAAHGKGLVHRDIKPENVFLTKDGGLKILDFGLVRTDRVVAGQTVGTTNNAPSVDTEPGMLLGTVLYMSPEQVRGQSADARSDLFALGSVLFEMLQGFSPFQKETSADTMAAILNAPMPHLSVAGTPIPRTLETIIAKCLEKQPERRYQSAREIVEALKTVAGDWLPSDSKAEAQNETAIFPAPTEQNPPSVAVLPFRNLSSDPENEYFSDGLAEELINAMTRVEGLHVAARTSSFAFKNRNEDIRKIGEQLNVGTILEGSVRKSGKRLRISAQLVSVSNGFQMWSQTYDRELADVFAIQDEIASSIANALQVILGEKAKKAIEKVAVTNVKAYEYYLRGRQFQHQFRRQGFEIAEMMFTQAILADPKYARAHAGISNCHCMLFTYWDPARGHLDRADEASRKALELDPDLAEAHLARGLALATGKKFAEARQEYETAIRLDPMLYEAHYYFGRACLAEGMLEDAAMLFAKAHQLRPEEYQAVQHLASICSGLGKEGDSQMQFKAAAEAVDRHIALHPDDNRALYLGANCWCKLGMPEKALEWADRALAMDPKDGLALYNVACVYSLLNQQNKALNCLEDAIKNGFSHKGWIEHDADLKPMRSLPRFQSILQTL
ncbi:MAG TPA: protein kinase [Gemmataceae bacterium]|nr:protein kinase [Gemmataceae bacterium]